MAHMIWKGAISFGLVHVPVQLYPATQSERVGFNLLDKRSNDPIGYRQINKRTGKEVSRDQIVRGFEYEKEHYVILTDEEIRAANPESTQTVDIIAFVDGSDIPFLYLDTPYYLAPDRKGEKVYALLREALKDSGKVGVASVVMHNRQHLAMLIPVGPVLALNTLRWAAEVRSYDELKLPAEGAKAAGLSSRELQMAKKLIDDMSDTWDPADYHDTFRDDILALVERKVQQGKIQEVDKRAGETREPRPSADILDLSELLKRSLGHSKGGRAARAKVDAETRDAEDDSGRATTARKRPATKRAKAGASGTAARKSASAKRGATGSTTRSATRSASTTGAAAQRRKRAA